MKRNHILIFVIAAAILLRLILCIINHESNDNHVEVVSIMADRHIVPEKQDCWSCFQPKLYYYINMKLVGWLHIKSEKGRIKVMQSTNFLCSLIILFFLFRFISKHIPAGHLRTVVFAMFALSPPLMGISVQATNDTMAIMFGVISIYFLDRLLSQWKLPDLAIVVVSLIAGSISKAGGVVIFLAALLVLFIRFITTGEKTLKRRVLIFGIATGIICTACILSAGNYYYNYKHFGKPFVSAFGNAPPPNFFHKTIVTRPGIRSVADGFFTFRFADMLRQPWITNGADDYPEHRTSFWSQLYGRSFFIHFEQYPHGWQKINLKIIWFGRAALILGLVPMLVFIIGFLILLKQSCSDFFRLNFTNINKTNSWMHVGITLAFVIFLTKFAYDIRDFSGFKPIYILPGLISFLYIFITGTKYAIKFIPEKMLICTIWALVAVHIYEFSYLAMHLYKFYHQA